jgi:methionyl-tRNA synthetase
MSSKQPRKILVTSALFYANGSIHLGHLVEVIQADIWVRYQKLRGRDCHYICGTDGHGTSIMLQAEKQSKAPEEFIKAIHNEQLGDFKQFHINFDHFSSTHSPTNQTLAEDFYHRLSKKGDIQKRTIRQLFDPVKNIFLPDRFVKGTCPKCNTADQYGDNCEACGATYSPIELKNPYSAISGATPIEKDSEHYFFQLPHYSEKLQAWTKADHVQAEMANKLQEWFEAGLQAWDISRDAPYFGFKIPGTEDKYFYVWVDAPIGYMSAFKEYCESTSVQGSLNFDEYWKADSQAELYHFIGKDILYFHALFWPAMLMSADYRTPTKIFVHGMLTVNGQKMSKSRGTFIKANTYLQYLNPEYLRYYYAAKLSNQISDIDLNLEDFRLRVNADLVGKVVNIASRCAAFIRQYFDNQLSEQLMKPDLYTSFVVAGELIAEQYESRDFGRAVREIMQLADQANQFIDAEKPWQAIKDPSLKNQVHEVCTLGLNLFRLLIIYLQPILPEMADKVKNFLCSHLDWDTRDQALLKLTIKDFSSLMQRIEETQIKNLVQDSQEDLQKVEDIKIEVVQTETTPAETESPKSALDLAPEITIDDFMKIDLRVAKIIEASYVEGAEKLLALTLDLGGETRTVFSGIRSAYKPENLVGKLTVMVANLAPRKMRFGLSSGMVLAAKNEAGLYLMNPDSGAKPGDRVA